METELILGDAVDEIDLIVERKGAPDDHRKESNFETDRAISDQLVEIKEFSVIIKEKQGKGT